ncbi:MAG: histidine phosphatase family protein [Nitriliruptorales bacterium]
MTREVEVRRHTDDEDDVLSEEGVFQALEIGRKLRGNYELVVSSGAQRATQTAACFLAGLGQAVPGGVVVNAGLRSDREDRWKEAYQEAGSGELSAFRSVAPDFVEEEADRLGSALREVIETLPEGGRALVVGHSPTNEAAVFGLTGEEVGPLSDGAGVLLVEEDGAYRVEPLDS